jgi:hypothetical protein
MPVLKYSDGKNSFFVEGGCLAVIGRSVSAASEISAMIDKHRLIGVKKVTFERILFTGKDAASIEYLPVMEKYMSMFPFMRCVLTPYAEILTTGDCTFDVENYSQNEVMHAMFHIRALAYTRVYALSYRDFPIRVMHRLMTFKGLPFWKAYLLCIIPHDASFREPVVSVNNVISGDANTFCLSRLAIKDFVTLLKGYQPVPSYVEGTVFENARDRVAYAQNISKYLQSPEGNGVTMGEFVKSIAVSAQDSTAVTGLRDAFGFPISLQCQKYEVSDDQIITALDKTIAAFGITEENMIC